MQIHACSTEKYQLPVSHQPCRQGFTTFVLNLETSVRIVGHALQNAIQSGWDKPVGVTEDEAVCVRGRRRR
jgi:hypothetical protein